MPPGFPSCPRGKKFLGKVCRLNGPYLHPASFLGFRQWVPTPRPGLGEKSRGKVRNHGFSFVGGEKSSLFPWAWCWCYLRNAGPAAALPAGCGRSNCFIALTLRRKLLTLVQAETQEPTMVERPPLRIGRSNQAFGTFPGVPSVRGDA